MAGYIEDRKTSWRLVVSNGLDKDKNQKKLTRTIPKEKCPTKPLAEIELAKFVAEIHGNSFIEPSKITLSMFVERWEKDFAEKNLAPKTLYRYKQLLNSRILPALGHLKVEKIKPIHLIEFYNNLTEDGIREDGRSGSLSERTIHHHHRLIHAILECAVQWQVILSNPAGRIRPPKVTKKQAVCYDEEQTAALIEALEKESATNKKHQQLYSLKHQTLINLAVFTGLRRGELMGLEWKDVNLEKGTLEVKRAGQYIPGQGTITKNPKNESSKRLVSIPDFCLTILKQYKAKQNEQRLKVGDLWQGSDRIFTTWDGKHGHPDWPSQWFGKFLKRHNLPPLPFHGLRHTAVTLLINENIPLVNISGRVGHSNTGTTGDIYSHYLKSADKKISEALENFYSRITNKA